MGSKILYSNEICIQGEQTEWNIIETRALQATYNTHELYSVCHNEQLVWKTPTTHTHTHQLIPSIANISMQQFSEIKFSQAY